MCPRICAGMEVRLGSLGAHLFRAVGDKAVQNKTGEGKLLSARRGEKVILLKTDRA